MQTTYKFVYQWRDILFTIAQWRDLLGPLLGDADTTQGPYHGVHRPTITVSAEATASEVARLLVERHISAVPVVDGDGVLMGIVSEGDLVRRPEIAGERRPS